MSNYAIILAAGKGTRMKSNMYKILHPVLGKPMISHVISNLNKANVDQKIVVVSKDAESVKALLNDVTFVVQETQEGTGHAVKMAKTVLENVEGTTLVVCGDTPLITSETLNGLIENHNKFKADATVLTTIVNNPKGYGRIIRDVDGNLLKIVEDKDTNEEEKVVNEINAGTFCFNNKKLFAALEKVKNDNKQKEYYLTDVIGILKNEGGIVSTYTTDDVDEILGVNDRVALEKANAILKRRINEKLMRDGVTIIDRNNTYISADTEIGPDTIIYPGTVCLGKNKIGSHCVIGPNTELMNTVLGNQVKIRHSVITDSTVGNNTTVGPFAHFRNDAVIGDHVRIGNFVEVKNSEFKDNSNAAHLAYIGDASIGQNVNMGCGTITVNYDGKNKHKTVVEDNAFVGCNSNLIAPVRVGEGAYIAAGSTINKDVPQDALAIARTKQENKEGYAKKYKK